MARSWVEPPNPQLVAVRKHRSRSELTRQTPQTVAQQAKPAPNLASVMAQIRRRPGPGLTVHSDRGIQYASAATRDFLAQHGWIASMSRTGNPYDNAWMESAIGKIKTEVLGKTIPADHAAARQQLFVGIECWYNQRRRHSALGYQSPVAFETSSMNN